MAKSIEHRAEYNVHAINVKYRSDESRGFAVVIARPKSVPSQANLIIPITSALEGCITQGFVGGRHQSSSVIAVL